MELYHKWTIRPPQNHFNTQNSINKPICAICATDFLKRGSFVFVGRQVLNLCAKDAVVLHELPAYQRDAAIAEMVERHEPDHWRAFA